MIQIKKKNLEPVEHECHFKYRCPNSSCDNDHWLTTLEAQTLNFKVVCSCGTVFKPKPISRIKILYKKQKRNITQKEDTKCRTEELPLDVENKCVTILVGYGFTKIEAADLVIKAFKQNPILDAGSLVKQVLISLGENNEYK